MVRSCAPSFIRVLYQDLTTRLLATICRGLRKSVLARSVEGPATSLACATGVRTTIHAHTVSVGLVRLAGEGNKRAKANVNASYSSRVQRRGEAFNATGTTCFDILPNRRTLGLHRSRSSFCRNNPGHLPLSACYVACRLFYRARRQLCVTFDEDPRQSAEQASNSCRACIERSRDPHTVCVHCTIARLHD